MKKLANLKGAKALNKKEQQSINGGGFDCSDLPSINGPAVPVCPPGYICTQFGCVWDDDNPKLV